MRVWVVLKAGSPHDSVDKIFLSKKEAKEYVDKKNQNKQYTAKERFVQSVNIESKCEVLISGSVFANLSNILGDEED